MSLEYRPHNYQQRAIDEMIAKPFFGLWMGVGLGKTSTSLKVIYHFKRPTLVVVPLSILYSTWLTEPKKWSFSETLTISVLHGKDKEQNFLKKAGLYLINPEGIPWLLQQVQKYRRFPWHILIVDESPKFKNPKSKRWKALVKLIGSFKRRYLLSGNPTPNRFSDIWAQIFLLDKGAALEKSFYKFQNKYMYPVDYMRFNWELKPGAHEEIVQRIAPMSMMISASDEIDLPKRVEVDKYIELDPKIMKKYKAMENDLFLALDQEEEDDDDDSKLLATNKGVALQKCWQIAQGFIYETIEPEDEGDEEVRLTHQLHEKNIELVKELIEEQQGSPTVIVYYFEEDLKRLTAAFPDAPILGRPTPTSETGRIVKEWNNDEHEVVLASPKRISHGANMQFGSGKTIIFYSLIYNADDYDQIIKRLERQGSEHSYVIAIRIIAKNTVHEAMISAVETKTNVSNNFLNAIKEYRDGKRKRHSDRW